MNKNVKNYYKLNNSKNLSYFELEIKNNILKMWILFLNKKINGIEMEECNVIARCTEK